MHSWRSPHRLRQLPQWSIDWRGLKHAPSHEIPSREQPPSLTQLPATQPRPGEKPPSEDRQEVPQPPQWRLSLVRSAQTAPQARKPLSQPASGVCTRDTTSPPSAPLTVPPPVARPPPVPLEPPPAALSPPPAALSPPPAALSPPPEPPPSSCARRRARPPLARPSSWGRTPRPSRAPRGAGCRHAPEPFRPPPVRDRRRVTSRCARRAATSWSGRGATRSSSGRTARSRPASPSRLRHARRPPAPGHRRAASPCVGSAPPAARRRA
jgi:hypothetical protein